MPSEVDDPHALEADAARDARQYDAMAGAYAAHNADSSYNAYYERPATIALLGDMSGSRVLELGCGPGALTEWLVAQGATVTAVDGSGAMVELTRTRVGGRAEVFRADVARPLTFAQSGSFDLIVASLVLHYIRDWQPVFREFRRVLTSRGSVVFSTHHPTMDARLYSPNDYFAVKRVQDIWGSDVGAHEISFWRRPLTAMTQAITAAGFVIADLVEPPPLPALAERDAKAYRRLTTQPAFLFFRLRAD